MLIGVTLGGQATAQDDDILIFGGDDHKEFLGCLTCSEFDGQSVWNKFSTHGWENGFGTWNKFPVQGRIQPLLSVQ
ncbi:MAG TPA: hypothetical protein VEA44_11640 [Caulobacter sp.]|nr:hypothetical protein [Caulobacter sp.]